MGFILFQKKTSKINLQKSKKQKDPQNQKIFLTQESNLGRRDNLMTPRKATWKIRKQSRKDRLNNTIKDLEDHLWHDIKKAKSAFVPSHTKLLNSEGKPCTSNERPNILAGYYGQSTMKERKKHRHIKRIPTTPPLQSSTRSLASKNSG